MKLPDKDQVREALEAWEAGDHVAFGPVEARALVAVARAFVEGRLIPGEVDYEAAAAMLYEMTIAEGDPEWEDLPESNDKAFFRLAWSNALAAALAGYQETPK